MALISFQELEVGQGKGRGGYDIRPEMTAREDRETERGEVPWAISNIMDLILRAYIMLIPTGECFAYACTVMWKQITIKRFSFSSYFIF